MKCHWTKEYGMAQAFVWSQSAANKSAVAILYDDNLWHLIRGGLYKNHVAFNGNLYQKERAISYGGIREIY